MSFFSDAMKFAFSAIEDARGELVSYTQQGTKLTNVLAVPRTSQEEAPDARRVRTDALITGWSIEKSKLPSIVPMRGDIIETAAGKKYQVCTPAGADYGWSDANETAYRFDVEEIA